MQYRKLNAPHTCEVWYGPVSVASPVGADWPITRAEGTTHLDPPKEDSLWHWAVDPGSPFALKNESQQNTSLHKRAACSVALHAFSMLIEQL